MKRFFAILLTVCLMASALCITVSAEGSSSVMRVQYGEEVKEFDIFDDGWNFAMEQAEEGKEVIVTLLKDWKADDGQFTDDFFNGAGFDWAAIYFAADVNVTLDLNGHTIDRGLIAPEANGEVMFINDNANVTIKNGTITGGYSNNGAGGIHIKNANVNLIDLVFTGNRVLDDDGAAIQHVDGGKLSMKNCRFENNNCSVVGLPIYGTVYLEKVRSVLIEDCYFGNNSGISYGGGIYAENIGSFRINNSTFENLEALQSGGAIWVSGMSNSLSIYRCTFNNNSCQSDATLNDMLGYYGGAIYAQGVGLYIDDSTFTGNYAGWDGGAIYFKECPRSSLKRCTFDGNKAGWDGGAIFLNDASVVLTWGCEFINNEAVETGGAIYIDSGCDVDLADVGSDPSVVKYNKAGEIGGGVFQHEDCKELYIGGEVYVCENVSSKGDDDLYIEDYYNFHIGYIESPEKSIGIRCKDDNGGEVAKFAHYVRDFMLDSFFANNEGMEISLMPRVASDGYRENFLGISKPETVGSVFGEGSLTMIVALVAIVGLVTSVVSICLIADMKKKTARVAADNTAETDDEE